MLKVLDLFSGIGGFSLGLESTGHFETIAFCEKDQFCQKVLQKNFKNIPIEGDVRNVKGDKYKADVVTGGFPCQPFSVAGKRKGTDDDRYLWDETIRVVRECKPKYFIGENVEGLINIQEGMVLRQVQTDLEKEGFEVQCLVIPASGIGAWHQRKRIWIIGCNVSNSNTRFGIRENQEIQTRGNTSATSGEDVPNSKSKWSRECKNINKKERLEESKSTQSDCICSNVPNTDSRMRRRRGAIGESRANEIWGFYSSEKEQSSNDIRSKTIGCNDILGEEQNLQYTDNQRCKESNISSESKKSDFSNREHDSTTENKTWWQTQSELCGVPNGVSYELDKDRANRVKSLGNSIVPQIARELGKAIIAAENEE
jgi:DNA (cytosine-5)-methyltransferase 1